MSFGTVIASYNTFRRVTTVAVASTRGTSQPGQAAGPGVVCPLSAPWLRLLDRTLPADRPHVQTIAPIAFKFATVLQCIDISRFFLVSSKFLILLVFDDFEKHLENFLERYLQIDLMSKPLLR